jgi:1-acyl-sn-glycerol-3-phosphate acyltransferase
VLYRFVKPLVVALMRVLFRVRGRGAEHVPLTGAVLLVANHASLLDPLLVGSTTPRPVAFLAKAELFRIPLFGGVIRRLNAQPVRRGGGDPRALRAALRVLEEGKPLLVFPEGTRGDESMLRPPKPGAGMLAVTSGVPVVPLYIQGSGRAWPRGRRLPRPRRVTVYFGPPLRFAQTATDQSAAAGDRAGHRKDRYEAASREMMAAIARLQAEATEATSPIDGASGLDGQPRLQAVSRTTGDPSR